MTDATRKRTVNRAAETRRKSAERQRRREAGERRVEVWLPEDVIWTLDDYECRTGFSRQNQIISLVREYGMDHQEP